mmetsp:Transcript_40894/g.62916  ORF Transcript_40894/g.62916 Transcript_40894/m.62916 type:complete len:85 (+) Transcript_40894:4391-4645(+)
MLPIMVLGSSIAITFFVHTASAVAGAECGSSQPWQRDNDGQRNSEQESIIVGARTCRHSFTAFPDIFPENILLNLERYQGTQYL